MSQQTVATIGQQNHSLDTPAPREKPDMRWEKASAKARDKAQAQLVLVRYLESVRMEDGIGSDSAAAEEVERRVAAKKIPDHVASALARVQSSATRATLLRHLKAYRKDGIVGLLPGHKGRPARRYAWELAAIRLYQKPQNREFSWIAERLRRQGFEDATSDRVRKVIQRLPKHEQVKGRMSPRERADKVKGFIRRDLSDIRPNDVWMADGHTVDVRVRHPETGNLFRPELTAWLDVKSRLIVAAFLGEAENQLATFYAFSHAVRTWGVCAIAYTDRGPGYVANGLTDEELGLFERMGTTHITALPHNARAKAHIERWFGVMERDFGKEFETFCGHGMDPEAARNIVTPKAADRERVQKLYPSYDEYWHRLQEWVTWYNRVRVHPQLKCTPFEAWSAEVGELVLAPAESRLLPTVSRTVTSGGEIRLFNMYYRAPDLIAHVGSRVLVEYDPWDGQSIRVLDHTHQRWLCDAQRVEYKPIFHQSVVEQARQKRAQASVARLERHAQEMRDRAGLAITHDQVLPDIEALSGTEDQRLEEKSREWSGHSTPGWKPQPDADDIELDIYDTDY